MIIRKPVKYEHNRMLITVDKDDDGFIVGEVRMSDDSLILELASKSDIYAYKKPGYNTIVYEEIVADDEIDRLMTYVFNNVAVEWFQLEDQVAYPDEVSDELREKANELDPDRKPIFIRTPFGVMGVVNESGDYSEIKFVVKA